MEVPYALPVINQPTPDGVPIYVPNPGLAVAGLSAATGVALARGGQVQVVDASQAVIASFGMKVGPAPPEQVVRTAWLR